MNSRQITRDMARDPRQAHAQHALLAGSTGEHDARGARSDDSRGAAHATACAIAPDDAYGCVEWFDFDASAAPARYRPEASRS